MEAKLVEKGEETKYLRDMANIKIDEHTKKDDSHGSYPQIPWNHTNLFYPPTSSVPTAFFSPQFAMNATYRDYGVEGSLDALKHLLSIKQNEGVSPAEKDPKKVENKYV